MSERAADCLVRPIEIPIVVLSLKSAFLDKMAKTAKKMAGTMGETVA